MLNFNKKTCNRQIFKTIAYFFLISYNKYMENGGKTVVKTEKPKISYSYKGKTYEDKDMIAYYKHENYIHKLENKLLGEYDESSRYTVPNEILKNLLALRKQIVKKDKQTFFLKSVCGKDVFEFKIEIGVVSKSESFAQLYLIEKAFDISGDEKIEISTPIVFYTDDSDAYFETKIKKIFNILSDDEVEGRMKENEAIAINLLEKIKFYSKVYERYLLESRLRDKIYIEKLLRILTQDQETGPIILKKYEELIKKYGHSLDSKNKNYYRVLKQLLDSILMEEEKNVSKEVALLIQRLRKVYVQANTETLEIISVPEKKVEKKQENIKLPSGTGQISFKSAPKLKQDTSPTKKFSGAVSGLRPTNETKSSLTNSVSKPNISVSSPNKSFFDTFSLNPMIYSIEKGNKTKTNNKNEVTYTK